VVEVGVGGGIVEVGVGGGKVAVGGGKVAVGGGKVAVGVGEGLGVGEGVGGAGVGGQVAVGGWVGGVVGVGVDVGVGVILIIVAPVSVQSTILTIIGCLSELAQYVEFTVYWLLYVPTILIRLLVPVRVTLPELSIVLLGKEELEPV
jgi:hypothetical protein